MSKTIGYPKTYIVKGKVSHGIALTYEEQRVLMKENKNRLEECSASTSNRKVSK